MAWNLFPRSNNFLFCDGIYFVFGQIIKHNSAPMRRCVIVMQIHKSSAKIPGRLRRADDCGFVSISNRPSMLFLHYIRGFWDDLGFDTFQSLNFHHLVLSNLSYAAMMIFEHQFFQSFDVFVGGWRGWAGAKQILYLPPATFKVLIPLVCPSFL